MMNGLYVLEIRNLETDYKHSYIYTPKRMRGAGHVARVGKRNAYRVLVRKSEGNRPLGGPRHMWENDIKIYLREI
jgi:hypothetical protein